MLSELLLTFYISFMTSLEEQETWQPKYKKTVGLGFQKTECVFTRKDLHFLKCFGNKS